MANLTPVSNFVPSGTPTVSLPTGMNGLGQVMNLPAVDASNLQLAVTNKGDHTLQVDIGATGAVPFNYLLAAPLRVGPNRTLLLSGLPMLAAATATTVSVSSSAPGCVATFQRGSLTTSQVAA